MPCIKKLLPVFLFLSVGALTAQTASTVRLIPNASIGYTFGKGINASLGCGVSLLDYKIGKAKSYAGFEFSYTLFTHKKEVYKEGLYKTFAINIMNVVNEMVITKFGATKSKLKWGVNNVNTSRSKTWGINFDLAFKPVAYSPHIGFRIYSVGNACMGIGQANPTFLYLGYQYPFVITPVNSENKPAS